MKLSELFGRSERDAELAWLRDWRRRVLAAYGMCQLIEPLGLNRRVREEELRRVLAERPPR